MNTISEQILEVIDQLTPDQQTQLLSLAQKMRTPALPEGVPGHKLVAAAEQIKFSPDYIETMMQIIEEGE